MRRAYVSSLVGWDHALTIWKVETDACSNSCHVIMKKNNTQSDHGRTNRLTIWKVYAAWLKFNAKVSGHHDINFLTPINSPQASPRRGGRETSSRGESFALFLPHHNQPPLRALLREGFWASSESSPSEWESPPYGIYVSDSNHLKPPWSKTLPVAAWRPSSLFYFHFSPSCLYFVNDIRENDLFS